MKSGVLYWLLVAIGVITVISGLVQLIAPAFVLSVVAHEQSATSLHLFAIVGMFMVLFGGLLLQALLGAGDNGLAVFWCGLQKLGASAAVGVGVLHEIFTGLALGIAGFDLLSGILIFVYLWKV